MHGRIDVLTMGFLYSVDLVATVVDFLRLVGGVAVFQAEREAAAQLLLDAAAEEPAAECDVVAAARQRDVVDRKRVVDLGSRVPAVDVPHRATAAHEPDPGTQRPSRIQTDVVLEDIGRRRSVILLLFRSPLVAQAAEGPNVVELEIGERADHDAGMNLTIQTDTKEPKHPIAAQILPIVKV